MHESQDAPASKVPEVTVMFWVIKILATTLGETAGDAVSMSLDLGYLVGSAIFASAFALAVLAQISARDFRPWLYWLTIIATTTVGTTLADYATRSLGIGYAGGSAALGDWTADTAGLGFEGGALIFGAMLIAIAAAHRWTRISPTALFWSAFILTRPLGAVVGDLLDKPVAQGGLALSRYSASFSILVVIALLVFFVPQRAARLAH